MQFYLILAGSALLLVGYVVFSIFDAGQRGIHKIKADNKTRRVANKKKARELQSAQEARAMLDFRNKNSVMLTGVPNTQDFSKVFDLLDRFTAQANAFRPAPRLEWDERFRNCQYSAEWTVPARGKPNTADGFEPQRIEMAIDQPIVCFAWDAASKYEAAQRVQRFPYPAPSIQWDPPAARALPALPKPNLGEVKLVWAQDRSPVDRAREFLAKTYKKEFERVDTLNVTCRQLMQEFERKHAAAREAAELRDIYLTKVELDCAQRQRALDADYGQSVRAWDLRQGATTLAIRNVWENYKARTEASIKEHFLLIMRSLPLPLPEDYHWDVFFNASERLLQINQCVPSNSDIDVRRTDSKRPPAKRDVEGVQRRYVPSIAISIGHAAAKNDLFNDVDTIAVNCWSRYFEPATGRSRDAFVAALSASKDELASLNLEKADALEAFRALRGAFVFSSSEVVPIEPQIRLDRNDDRFVAGRDVLDGMAQGQNLSEMDWQDFEHLIRELLSKEYASENSEVKITRASRDRGVDAIVFNSDPLHGGKFVVQAKRYSNTVDVAAVRELYGTVLSEGANRGILVTTSQFGRDAYDWAKNKPLTLLDGQNLLSLLSKHGYSFQIKPV